MKSLSGKLRLIGAILLFGILVSQIVFAEENGRYQMIVMPKVNSLDADKIVVLDTKEGHIWTWSNYQKVQGVSEGGRYLTYQGKVRTGQKSGEVIYKEGWLP
jgi:hypothetical protein